MKPDRCTVILALVLLIGSLSGCVAPTTKMTVTASVKPEVFIQTGDTGQIKALIIGELVNFGYNVEQDSESSLTLSRALEGSEDITAALTTGNRYATNRRFASYTFIKSSDGVRVVVSVAWRSQAPGGQVRTTSLDNNGDVFNNFQTHLLKIKSKIEGK